MAPEGTLLRAACTYLREKVRVWNFSPAFSVLRETKKKKKQGKTQLFIYFFMFGVGQTIVEAASAWGLDVLQGVGRTHDGDRPLEDVGIVHQSRRESLDGVPAKLCKRAREEEEEMLW